MDSNRFNCIVVLDSIPSGEFNTARRLRNDLESHAAAYPPTPAIAYTRIENREDLFRTLDECCARASKEDLAPLLHIECHGDDFGFQLADGSIVDWAELKRPLTEINVAMRLNLMVVVAACTGGALARIVDITDRAPVWGLIGPTKTVLPAELESVYGAFYRTLLRTKSPAEAVRELDRMSSPGLFWRATAQGLFETAWTLYRENYCTADVLETRVQRMQERARVLGLHVPSVDELKKVLAQSEPQSFERFHRVFFMQDIYSEHRHRFNVPY